MSLHYYPLINRIITSLNLQDTLLAHHRDTSFVHPFITISREPGSGGAPIAKAVAEKLDFDFIDKQFVTEIAHSTKKRKEVIKAVDEKSRTAIEDIIHSFLNDEYVDDMSYLSELVRIILVYALRGRVVILGRGANFVTPFAKGLHVRITSPYEVRVKRTMDFEGMSRDKAREVIRKVELERKKFVKQYLGQDINRANAYDLTLNTSYFTVDQARDVILNTFYQKFPRSVRYQGLLGRK